MPEIILTNTGKLGDFLYCLPIASWLAKDRGVKIHWVLPGSFDPFNYIEHLLMRQAFTSRVSIVPYQVRNFDCGGQPYRFNPSDYGIEWGEYYNLGFRSYPDKYLSAFYAAEYGFSYDQGFRLDIGSRPERNGEIIRSREGAMARLVSHAEPLPPAVDLLHLARRMAAAREVHTWFCGLAVLCYFSGISVIVHRVPGHAPINRYFEGDYSHVTSVEHPCIP